MEITSRAPHSLHGFRQHTGHLVCGGLRAQHAYLGHSSCNGCCQTDSTAPAEAPAAAPQPGQGANVPSGNLRLMGFASSPEEDRLLNQVLGDFTRQYPSIQVKFEPVPELLD
jgi:ABC-type glycerol-3-phosphate transport system substrate-binding protein